ncbi:MAG: M1 family metallopeptidase [Nanoarchaeota archaeon]
MQSAKLSKEVMPENYNLLIEPSHDNLTFKGKVEINLLIDTPTNNITLHSSDLKISKASLKSNPKDSPKIELSQKEETLKLTFKNKISNADTLIIEFSGTISDKLKGFYKAKYFIDKKEKTFLTTQFEAPYARRAFPCFDEPSKKATFDFSVKINSNLTAVSNMPIEKEEKSENKKIVTFQQSPIMSTYLLYFGIGELEFLEDTYKNIKLRIVTTPGKSKDGKFALDLTKKFLKYFEDYSGIDYPLPKLDLIAVPDFEAGAMENWGAITFREILLLQNEKTSTSVKKRIAEVIAHELWHQWSGNLVTMDWWEDLWLNESFATYMAFKAMNHYFPEWNSLEDFVIEETSGAFSKDSLKTTHSIAVKVNNPNEISEIFDAISYGKGGSVLKMIESFLGEENFKKGVQKYLLKYKYKNAIASDLWDSLADFSKEPIKKIMIDWLTKPGYPLIEVSKKENLYTFKQKKFNSKNDKTTWKIPLTIKNKDKTLKQLFDNESQSTNINSHYIKLNEGQNGFYRTKYDSYLLKELSQLILNKQLSAIDRYGIQNDLFYLCLFGEVSLDTYLNFISCYKNEDNYTVLLDLCSNLREIYNAFSQENLSKENWKKFKQISISPFKNKIKSLGLQPKLNEPQQDTLTRAISINYLQFAEDKETLDFCKQQFNKFLKDTNSVHPDIKGPIIAASAENGNKETYTQLLETYKKTDNVEEKLKILASLFRFKDESILKSALDFSLTKEVRIQDLRTVFSMIEANSSAEKFFFNWIKNNWNKLKDLEKSPYIFMGLIRSIIILSKKEDKPAIKQFLIKEKVEYESTKSNAFETSDIYNNWIEKNKDILKNYLDKIN